VNRRVFLAAFPALLLGASSKPGGLDDLFQPDTFATIPPGVFRMGNAGGLEDERPLHEVRISRAFQIAKLEVTQPQWEAVMRDPHQRGGQQPPPEASEPPISATPSHFKGEGFPVESVSWEDVQVFLTRLNSRESTYSFRLPSEAEWEYACHGGTKATDPKHLADEAWFKDNSGASTNPVGQKQPNGFGLYDMNGNVAEWVQDWYAPDYYVGSPRTDPKGPGNSSYRVFRGGAWLTEASLCRPTIRNFDFPNSRFYHVGFRLVRTAK